MSTALICGNDIPEQHFQFPLKPAIGKAFWIPLGMQEHHHILQKCPTFRIIN